MAEAVDSGEEEEMEVEEVEVAQCGGRGVGGRGGQVVAEEVEK